MRAYEEESSALFSELAGKEAVKIRDVDTEAMRRVAERYGFTVPKDFWEISIRMHEKYGQLFPDAVDTIKALKGMGLHVGIITDSDNDYITAHLKALGIYDLFDSITTSEEAGFFKPHPRPFQLALEKAGVKPEEALYVGDNPKKDCVGAKTLNDQCAPRSKWGKEGAVGKLRLHCLKTFRGRGDN